MKIDRVFQNILSLEKEICLTEKEIKLLKAQKEEQLRLLKEKRDAWVKTANRKIKATLYHEGISGVMRGLDSLSGETERILGLLAKDIQSIIRAG